MSKSIVLKGLYINNFKGIKELDIDFSSITNIFGENATGKTSIFDAFTWLLFDKDSHNRSKFDVQPLDENNNIVHMLETEVSAVLEIDGRNTNLKKILKEKWVKPKGKPESELKGTESIYYVDEVPKKQTEYKNFINELISEDIFKLLTNPIYFSTSLKWQDQKKILMELMGEFTDETVIQYKESLSPLRELLDNKNIEEFKKSISATKKKLIKDKESIPARVDEVYKKIKDDIDFDALEFRKRVALGEMQNVDEELLDSSKVNDSLLAEKDELYSLKDKLRDIEYNAKIEAEEPKKQIKENIYNIQDKKSKIDREIKLIEIKTDSKKNAVNDFQNEMNKLRANYKKVAAGQFEFPEDQTICPLCKRPFDEDHIEETRKMLEENFNVNKAEKLKKINEQGKSMKDKVEVLNKEIQDLNEKSTLLNAQALEIVADLNETQDKYQNFKPELNLEANEEYQELKTQIEQIELKLSQPKESNNQVNDLKDRKRILQSELEDVNSQLFYREQNKELEARIKDLQAQEKDLAQKIADIEKQEFLCDDFIKTKVELLESSINSKFKYVKFKFFKTQVNGGIEECCEALVSGVPFSNANTASQINAGLDIIDTLCSHYGLQAPVFIDNRESVNQIIESNSQIINLIVSNDKKLKISNVESEVA